MGLSASQARLLSITQRLSDNELHSEIIANSKMRLADESIIAKNNYVNALDATKLQYVGFDGYGNTDTVDLTFNSLMLYSEIKNQNILKNSNGQVLISDTDRYNYETSRDMYEFVSRYCPDIDYSDYLSQLAGHTAWEAQYEQYLDDYNVWWSNYQQYLAAHAEWEDHKDYFDTVTYPAYQAAYNAWQSTPNVHNIFVGVVGTSSNPLSCYANALGDNTNCYKHVLMYLLYPIDDGVAGVNGVNNGILSPTNPEPLTTSLMSGENPVIVSPTQSDWYNSILHSTTFHTTGNQLLPVYQTMLDENTHKCDGTDDDVYNCDSNNLIQHAIDSGRMPYDWEILMSDYIYDYTTGECTGLKSLRQKTIDMLELIKNTNNYLSNPSQPLPTGVTPQSIMHNLLINFTDGDMQKLAWNQTPPVFNEPEPEFNDPEPICPPEPPLPDMYFQDKPLVQWYINLWHAIDGQPDPNELRAKYDENGVFQYYTAENKEKQTQYLDGVPLNPAFQVIPDELRGDANWLQHALANGIISINQVIMDSNANKLVWAGIEYTSTTSFNEVADNKKVAKAEAEYQAEMKRIENEDSKYDMKLKKLDTEHSALKTEYESVAGLIGKNIERSYKIFDA